VIEEGEAGHTLAKNLPSYHNESLKSRVYGLKYGNNGALDVNNRYNKGVFKHGKLSTQNAGLQNLVKGDYSYISNANGASGKSQF